MFEYCNKVVVFPLPLSPKIRTLYILYHKTLFFILKQLSPVREFYKIHRSIYGVNHFDPLSFCQKSANILLDPLFMTSKTYLRIPN